MDKNQKKNKESMSVFSPKIFQDVQAISDKFVANEVVLLNLRDVDRVLLTRIIDFASGLTYGLKGGMQRVGEKYFMLVPEGIEVSDEMKKKAASSINKKTKSKANISSGFFG